MKINAVYNYDEKTNTASIASPLTGLSHVCPIGFNDELFQYKLSDDDKAFLQKHGYYADGFGELLSFEPVVSPYCIWCNHLLIFMDSNNVINKISIDCTKAHFLDLCNGKNTLNEILDSCKLSAEDINDFLLICVSPQSQVIKLLPPQMDGDNTSRTLFPTYMVQLCEQPKAVQTDTTDYYQKLSEESAFEQFDNVETTISYMFREKNSILSNKSYGERLFEILHGYYSQHNSDSAGISVLEIGAGLGDVARSILEYAPTGTISDYTICDISKALLDFQKKRIGDFYNGTRIHYVHNDILSATCLDKYDIIICNEVIADLPSTELRYCSNDNTKTLAESLHYGLDDYINTGALELISRLKSLLKKGGIAFISEYCEPNSLPTISAVMHDHQETSIDFSLLGEYSNSIGFDASILPLASFLQIDATVNIVSPESFYLLKSAYKTEKYFISAEDLNQINFHNFRNIKMEELSEYVKYFFVLLLRK